MSSEVAVNGRGRGGRSKGRGTKKGHGRGARGHGRGMPGLKNPRNANNAFKGSTPGMNQHVFQVFGESSDKQQYTKTLEANEGLHQQDSTAPQRHGIAMYFFKDHRD